MGAGGAGQGSNLVARSDHDANSTPCPLTLSELSGAPTSASAGATGTPAVHTDIPSSLAVWSSDFHAFSINSSIWLRLMISGGDSSIES